MCDSTTEPAGQASTAGVRVVMLHLPEDEGEGLGFKLTRTLWDPYPWVREVTGGGRADAAGLRSGDCVLQADGRDLLGLPVGQVAGLIRGDGGGHGVSLLVWSCGTSPQDDPELLWSAGGGVRGERSRRALSGVLRALACAVCSATVGLKSSQCTRGHLYCAGCRARLQRCALCRETLPAVDSPQAKNLVAEQVFEAIASVYELKDTIRVPNVTPSTSVPQRSPLPIPKVPQVSASQKNSPSSVRRVQFGLTTQPYHGSDNSLNRPIATTPEWSLMRSVPQTSSMLNLPAQSNTVDSGSQTDLNEGKSEHGVDEKNRPILNHCQINDCCRDASRKQHRSTFPNQTNSYCQNSFCTPQMSCCQKADIKHKAGNCLNTPGSCPKMPAVNNSQALNGCCSPSDLHHNERVAYCSQPSLVHVGLSPVYGLQHRLVARLRPACSLVDLRCTLSGSTGDIKDGVPREKGASADNLQSCEAPTPGENMLYVMEPAAPVLVWACEHSS